MHVDIIKIIPIFEKNLYSFSYNDDAETVFHKLIKKWTDPDKLSKIAASKNMSFEEADIFRKTILRDVKSLTRLIKKCLTNDKLNEFFVPYHNNTQKNVEYQESKGKFKSDVTNKTSKLRIYALRINNNEFIITGGTIKLTKATQGETYSQKQVDRMNSLRRFLKENGYDPEDIIYHLNCDL